MQLNDDFTIYASWTDDDITRSVDRALSTIRKFHEFYNAGLWPKKGERCVIADGEWGSVSRADVFTGPDEVNKRLRDILEGMANYMRDEPERGEMPEEGEDDYRHTCLSMIVMDNRAEGSTDIVFRTKDTTYQTIHILPLVSDLRKEEEERERKRNADKKGKGGTGNGR